MYTHIYLSFFFKSSRLQVVRTVLASCVRCCTASIDRSSEKHRVTGQWRRPFPSLVFVILPLARLSLSHSIHFSAYYPLPIRFSVSSLLLLSICIAYIYICSLVPSQGGPRYPNSISVQLQFIPVSKRQFTLRSSLPRESE